jgi:hypothetical protein
MDLPKPPPGMFPSSNSAANSDLMKRLGNFLPKMQAANEDLETVEQIDVDMIADDDGEDDEEEGECAEPTIQLKLQLGDIEKNQAVFDMLSKKDDDEDASKDKEQTAEAAPASAKEGAVSKLLQETAGAEKVSSATKKGKVLIEELS